MIKIFLIPQPPLLLLSPCIWAERRVWDTHHGTSQRDATPTLLHFIFLLSQFFTPNSHSPPPFPNTPPFSSDDPLSAPNPCISQTIREKTIHSSHRVYIHCIYTTSLSDLTGCAQQWMVSRVLRSTQGVIPTVARWSELSLAQQTGGAEAKRLFLPRERGCWGEKRWTGANSTSLPAFKFQEKMDFCALRGAEKVDTVWCSQSRFYLTSALLKYCI